MASWDFCNTCNSAEKDHCCRHDSEQCDSRCYQPYDGSFKAIELPIKLKKEKE